MDERSKKSRHSTWTPIFVIIFASGIFVSLSAWWYYQLSGGTLEKCPTRAGLIGDAFGPLTSLFGSLAFLAAVTSTYYQIKEFGYQLKEIAENREELTKQTEALKGQLDQAKAQTSFMEIQRIHSRVMESVERLPYFHISYEETYPNASHKGRQITIENHGQTIYSLQLSGEDVRFVNDTNITLVLAAKDTLKKMAPTVLNRPIFHSIEKYPKSAIDCLLISTDGGMSPDEFTLTIGYVLSDGVPLLEDIVCKVGHSASSERRAQTQQLRDRKPFIRYEYEEMTFISEPSMEQSPERNT